MENKKYPSFINEISDYLIGISNHSKVYVENIITTIMQFLAYINTYKFNGKFDSLDKMTANDIRSLSKSDIYSFIYYLADKDYKEGTRILKLEHLRTFFDYMYRIKKNLFKEPFKEIKREKRYSERLPNYLSLEEAKKVLKVYENSENIYDIRNYAMLTIFLTCGVRLSELRNMQISNINFEENKFTIIGKGNKERMCYLNKMTKQAIIKYLEIRNKVQVKDKKDTDILFISQRKKRMSCDIIQYIVKTAYEKAGIDSTDYSVHTLRHTCATILIRNGIDIKIIQEILGHARIETTQIYTHIYNRKVEKEMMKHPLAQFKMKDALAFCA